MKTLLQTYLQTGLPSYPLNEGKDIPPYQDTLTPAIHIYTDDAPAILQDGTEAPPSGPDIVINYSGSVTSGMTEDHGLDSRVTIVLDLTLPLETDPAEATLIFQELQAHLGMPIPGKSGHLPGEADLPQHPLVHRLNQHAQNQTRPIRVLTITSPQPTDTFVQLTTGGLTRSIAFTATFQE